MHTREPRALARTEATRKRADVRPRRHNAKPRNKGDNDARVQVERGGSSRRRPHEHILLELQHTCVTREPGLSSKFAWRAADMMKMTHRRGLNRAPRELPAYGIREAAHYLRIPESTLRSWILGRYYPTGAGKKFFEPLIRTPHPNRPVLSFVNLVEVHVLDAIRRQHEISLGNIRRALDYLARHFRSKHPLANHHFETDGIDLFIERYGRLINISQAGQLALRSLLQAHLRRIERDTAGLPIRLYPFTRKRDPEEPKFVVIDPYVCFGRPVLVGTGIPTDVIAERYKAGESIDELAKDYGRSRLEIEEAIRCELEVEAA